VDDGAVSLDWSRAAALRTDPGDERVVRRVESEIYPPSLDVSPLVHTDRT